MQKIESRIADKSAWGDGPWQDEPDFVLWQDEATGLPCMIMRADFGGHLCGYVGLTAEHPYYQQDPFEVRLGLAAHGGINYSRQLALSQLMNVEPVPDDTTVYWWLGFDCGHAWDFCPARRSLMIEQGMPAETVDAMSIFERGSTIYRPLDYVFMEVTHLAAQLHALAKPATVEA